jgi:hypothetical protein
MYVDWFVFFSWMPLLLTFVCHSVSSDYNQLTGSIPSELKELTSLTFLSLCTWIGLSFSHECHGCSYFLAILFRTDSNQLTGSIQTELRALTSLTTLDVCTWIALSCSYECHACSHLLAILFHQLLMNSRVQSRTNSESSRRWLTWISVRRLVCLVHMNVTLAHIFLPLCSVSF